MSGKDNTFTCVGTPHPNCDLPNIGQTQHPVSLSDDFLNPVVLKGSQVDKKGDVDENRLKLFALFSQKKEWALTMNNLG